MIDWQTVFEPITAQFRSGSFLAMTFSLLFSFWPVMLITPLKGRRDFLANMLSIWVILAVGRIFLFFLPQSELVSLFIPEPFNTILFFFCGAVLFGIYFLKKNW